MFFYDVLLFNIENWEDDDKPWNWRKFPTIFRQTCELSSAAGSILNKSSRSSIRKCHTARVKETRFSSPWLTPCHFDSLRWISHHPNPTPWDRSCTNTANDDCRPCPHSLLASTPKIVGKEDMIPSSNQTWRKSPHFLMNIPNFDLHLVRGFSSLPRLITRGYLLISPPSLSP